MTIDKHSPLSDLTDQEWREVELAAKEASADEIGPDTIIVRSHVWPMPDGSAYWLAFIENTDHRARGTASSVSEAYKCIDRELLKWYPDLQEDETGHMTVVRMKNDG